MLGFVVFVCIICNIEVYNLILLIMGEREWMLSRCYTPGHQPGPAAAALKANKISPLCCVISELRAERTDQVPLDAGKQLVRLVLLNNERDKDQLVGCDWWDCIIYYAGS